MNLALARYYNNNNIANMVDQHGKTKSQPAGFSHSIVKRVFYYYA